MLDPKEGDGVYVEVLLCSMVLQPVEGSKQLKEQERSGTRGQIAGFS